jgi:heat shock protein HslJ
MNYRTVWLIAFIGLSGWLAACVSLRATNESSDLENVSTLSSATDSPVIYPSPLAGTEWSLIALNGQTLFPHTEINISFSEQGYSGRDGCNNYWGYYIVNAEDKFFTVTGPDGFGHSHTLLGCRIVCNSEENVPCDEQILLKQENAYHDALLSTASYHLENDRLEMHDTDGQTRLVFAPLNPEVKRPILESGTWQLVHIIDGETTILPLSGTEITLQFIRRSEQGIMRGTLGCNNYRALYDIPAGGLDLVWFRITDKTCDEPEGIMERESYVLNLLTRMRTLAYDNQQLWMQTHEGQELFFRR